jgi:predicted O-linked N-acetylglucosamine transferase (SPINDLY family)
LLVKSTALDDPGARDRFLQRLESAGLRPARVDLRGTSAHAEHLKCYQEIDLVLDPIPHGGGIATAEALFMGLPAVTLLGATPASRVSAAVQSAAGVREWIAHTPDEYVGICAQAAGDLARLAETRRALRARASASALGNTRLYCRAVESTYRRLWRHWCDSG